MKKTEVMAADLGPKPKFILATNGLFKNNAVVLNLNTVNDVDVLVGVLASLMTGAEMVAKARKRLGLEEQTYMHDGFSINDWETDIKNKVKMLEWNKKKAKLDQTTAKLNSLMSEDARTSAELDKIMKDLG